MSVIDRRTFLAGACGLAAASVAPGVFGATVARSRAPGAVLFDAFPVFDPRSIHAAVQEAFPDAGRAIATAWFGKVFAYTWVRTTAGRYAPFDEVVRDALRFVVKESSVEMPAQTERDLVARWSELAAWPDAGDALERLRSGGVRLAFLSNMTEAMLRANARRNGLEGMFEAYLSTDRVREYKPAARAYAMGVDELGLERDRTAFAAFAGWDAQGAAWFGYRTVWVNRLAQRREELGEAPIETVSDLGGLVTAVARK